MTTKVFLRNCLRKDLTLLNELEKTRKNTIFNSNEYKQTDWADKKTLKSLDFIQERNTKLSDLIFL